MLIFDTGLEICSSPKRFWAVLTLYVIHADSGTKVNLGHQRNIQGHIGTLKKKKDYKKMQDFLMFFLRMIVN